MKTMVYKLINKMGYKIHKKRSRVDLYPALSKFKINHNKFLFYKSGKFIESLYQKYNNLLITDHKNGFMVEFKGIKVYVESFEEFFILEEVFVNNDYRFLSKKDTTVIDIGANIGISSLYFSLLEHVKAIYAFEPVIDTFEQANYNFSLNEGIRKVKQIKNIGLAGNNREATFLFNRAFKGNTGLRGILSPSFKNTNKSEERRVKLREASAEIKEITGICSEQLLLVKMDCEGAEYEILQNLYDTQTLHLIDVLIIEWHDKGAEKIEELLIEASFNITSRQLSPISGIICAQKS